MGIRKIAVIGAGVMGCDVALHLACFDFEIILIDISDQKLEEANRRIIKDLRMLKMMKPEAKSLNKEEILSKITFSTDYNEFESIDLVIENVTEHWETKKAIYDELSGKIDPEALVAVNTSCISITQIASLLKKPENVIGVHFMNPVPLKVIVETIRGFHTSKETEARMVSFLKAIEKNPVVVNDYPGFVANRLSHLFMNEAAFLVQDNVATPAEIDMIFKQGYEHKMGPLETADLIGLDTVMQSLEVLYQNYQDPKFRCCPLLRKMVSAGLLGRKSGKGFYTY